MFAVLWPIAKGIAVWTGVGSLAYLAVKSDKKPEEGSIQDSFNDAVNAAPTIAKWAAIGSVATAGAVIYKNMKKGKK